MGRHFVTWAALAAAVLAPAPGNVFFAAAQEAAGCTTNSFTTPSWLVEGFATQTSADLTVVSFHALNRATNVMLEMRCTSAGAAEGWQNCSARNRTETAVPLVAEYLADGETAQFRFNETWTCDDIDYTNPLTFTAVGDGSVPLDCETGGGSTTCRAAKPLLIKASLVSPVSITPVYNSGPPGHAEPGCASGADGATWEVTTTQLNLQDTTGQYPTGNVFIVVRNDHVGFGAFCGGFLTGTADPTVLTCSGQTAVRRPDRYQIETAARFDPVTFTLSLEQTWFCDDEDPASPLAITATAETVLAIDCEELRPGTSYCSGGSPQFSGSVTSREPVQPHSLNDPLATGDSCTVASIASPAWWLSGFETNTTADGARSVTARFGMELQTGADNPPTGYAAQIVAHGVPVHDEDEDVPLDDLPWNECVIESAGDWSLAPTGCEFKYQMASRYLGLRADWQCSDLDPANPIAFSGEMRTLVPGLTCVTSAQGVIRCSAPSLEPWRVNVTSVSWE